MSINAPSDDKPHNDGIEATALTDTDQSATQPNEQPCDQPHGEADNSVSATPTPFATTADNFGSNAFDTPTEQPAQADEAEASAEETVTQGGEEQEETTKQEEHLPATQEEDSEEEADSSEEEEEEEDKPMTLRDHFTELRKRLFWCFAFAILGFAICYPFAQEIFTILVHPLDAALPAGSKFQYTAAHEAFFTFMKVAFIAGIFLTSPFIFYQVWAFIAPGLYDSEKMFVVPVSIASAVFFIGGGAFCYFVVFPFAFEFFMQYSNDRIIAMPTLNESFGFVLQMLVAFGLVFELPLFIFFLARLGLVTADFLRQTRRYAILVIVIVAAILTPPDVISQMLMAAPLYLLYEFSILIAQFFGKQKPKDEEEEEEDEEDEGDDTEEAKNKPHSAA